MLAFARHLLFLLRLDPRSYLPIDKRSEISTTRGIAGARAYIELMSPLPGVMNAGRLLNDDEALPPGAADGLDGTSACGSLRRSSDVSADTS